MNTPTLRFKEFSGAWEVKKLGDVFKITSGTTPLRANAAYFENGQNSWVKTTDLNNGRIIETSESVTDLALKETSLKILPKGTVLVAMYGGFNQIGRTGLLTKPASVNQALSAILPNYDLMNPYYLLTFLNYKVDEWKSFAASSRKDPNITKKDVESFIVQFPTLPEQTKIANFLTAIDEKIAQLSQTTQLLTDYKKGVMQQIFSQQLRFKDDDGREFAEWEEKSLGEICTIKRGASPRPISDKKWFDDDSKIGWVRISDVSRSNKFLTQTEQYLSTEGVSKSRLIKKGNIIMSICATIGKPIYTTFDVCIHDGFVVFDELQITHEFLYYYLMLIEKNWYQYGQAGSQVNLNTEIVSNESIFIPCEKEQIKIANFLTAIDDKINHNQTQLDAMKQYKAGLLQQMFV